MYIDRSLELNKVLLMCAMEGDWLSVGIAPLILNLSLDGCGCQTVRSIQFTAREKAVFGGWLEAATGLLILEKR